jgi:hypothetical protein
LGNLLLIVPLCFFCIWMRRDITWRTVITRKEAEMVWFKSLTWVIMHWRKFYGFSLNERALIEKQMSSYNSDFVPKHWDARDTMNDTQWIANWIQEVSYVCILGFATCALVQYTVYGIGVMEVGTYYALLQIYGHVKKYLIRLAAVFVQMQQAVVSLREISAILNQSDQRASRKLAARWSELYSRSLWEESGAENPTESQNTVVQSANRWLGMNEDAKNILYFASGVTIVRPKGNRQGMIFGEFKLQDELELPLGRMIGVSCNNEAVLQSFLGMIAQVIHPYGNKPGEFDMAPNYRFPRRLRFKMMSVTAFASVSALSGSVAGQLQQAGAPAETSKALARCVGLDPEVDISCLPSGQSQVFLIIKAVVDDPDVLCCYKPLSLVSSDMRDRCRKLLIFWQMGGGFPAIAKLLGTPLPETSVYRSPNRTLVMGNPSVGFLKLKSLYTVDLNAHLWRGSRFQRAVSSSSSGVGEETAVDTSAIEKVHRQVSSPPKKDFSYLSSDAGYSIQSATSLEAESSDSEVEKLDSAVSRSRSNNSHAANGIMVIAL